MMSIKLILGIILIVTLAFSAGLLYNKYEEAIRWQGKAIITYWQDKMWTGGQEPKKKLLADKHEGQRTNAGAGPHNRTSMKDQDCPDWLKQSPLVTALGVWIGMISNIATLAMAFLSMMFLFWAYKEMRECHDNKNKSMPHLGKAVLCNPPVVDLVKKKLDG
jgi:hypothetical protein